MGDVFEGSADENEGVALIDPLAGKPAPASALVDLSKLTSAFFSERPDAGNAAERVKFGTSGHRGSSLTRSFNEAHIVAITQAICDYRKAHEIGGPLFIGRDTHALSKPACDTALEVLAAHEVDVMVSSGTDYTPTPVISHAILTYNATRPRSLADGIVITPSHNPPEDGGFKYNPPSGGPAPTDVTSWIERRANEVLNDALKSVRRVTLRDGRPAPTVHAHDYVTAYVNDLVNVIDFDAAKATGVRAGVDPLGGAGVAYWPQIASRYHLDLTVVDSTVDMTFAFMTLDWDGRIRMDPSSPYAMQRLLNLRDRFDIAFACDTDHDRHGIVTRTGGLLQPNHYLAACVAYLFSHRPAWPTSSAVGKTIVSSTMIDRAAESVGRHIFETPVGFKWFVDGLLDGSLGFGGEESAGASLVRRDGSVWTTDKDGIALGLLAIEMTGKTNTDPNAIYQSLVQRFGECFYARTDARCTPEQAKILAALTPTEIAVNKIAGDPIISTLSSAPGNGAPIGGLKVATSAGWFALRPSGTEPAYKIYAESFRSEAHLGAIQDEAAKIVEHVLQRS